MHSTTDRILKLFAEITPVFCIIRNTSTSGGCAKYRLTEI